MFDRSFRRRITVNGRKTRSPQPNSLHHRRIPTHRRAKPSKSIKVLQRSSSEPILWSVGLVVDDEYDKYSKTDVLLCRPQTCTDVFTSSFLSPSLSTHNYERYNKDAKVVVNVTVEGSPGPVRTMVKLGSSVEDTIKLVIDKYGEEGRTPHLHHQDSSSSFELHHSHFSLESLNKRDKIGDVGSRSFYLRRSGSGRSSGDGETQLICYSTYGSESEIVYGGRSSTDPVIPTETEAPLLWLMNFIGGKMRKIGRRTCKVWKVLGCMYCE